MQKEAASTSSYSCSKPVLYSLKVSRASSNKMHILYLSNYKDMQCALQGPRRPQTLGSHDHAYSVDVIAILEWRENYDILKALRNQTCLWRRPEMSGTYT